MKSLKVAIFSALALAAGVAAAEIPQTCTVAVLDPNYSACAGFYNGENDSPAEIAAIANSLWGAQLGGETLTSDLFTKIDPPVNATPNSDPYKYTINLGGSFIGDFIISLKQSNGFSVFFFNDISAANPMTSISFTSTTGFSSDGQPGLSHYTYYGTTAPIPEPETYALMLAGLGAVGFMARRRKAAAAAPKAA